MFSNDEDVDTRIAEVMLMVQVCNLSSFVVSPSLYCCLVLTS